MLAWQEAGDAQVVEAAEQAGWAACGAEQRVLEGRHAQPEEAEEAEEAEERHDAGAQENAPSGGSRRRGGGKRGAASGHGAPQRGAAAHAGDRRRGRLQARPSLTCVSTARPVCSAGWVREAVQRPMRSALSAWTPASFTSDE